MLQFPGSVDGPWRQYVDLGAREPGSVNPDNDPRRGFARERTNTAPGLTESGSIGTVRYPRAIPRDEECAAQLKRRTLTNLYNQNPTWLQNVHRALDEAVFAAYGWPPDLSADQILEKLLALNLQRV